jgi:hypothetical protein
LAAAASPRSGRHICTTPATEHLSVMASAR